MLKDILGQAWEAMVYNRRRTAITMVGMAWGIATVVLLVAYGAGFSNAIETIFAKFGTNTIIFWGNRTSEQAGGDKAGVNACASRSTTSIASPTAFPASCIFRRTRPRAVPVQNDLHTYTWSVDGVRPSYQEIWKLNLEQGRFFDGADDQQRAHVCILGSENKTKLFSGGWALGETIRLNGEIFTVIGVMKPKMQEGDNDDSNRNIYIPFNTMSDLVDTHYLDSIWLDYRGDQRIGREGSSRDHGRGASLPPLGSQRDGRGQPDDPGQGVSTSVDCAVDFAHAGGRADAGHRRHRPDEHHAGGRAAAHPRDRH